jgi:hypothetical protein
MKFYTKVTDGIASGVYQEDNLRLCFPELDLAAPDCMYQPVDASATTTGRWRVGWFEVEEEPSILLVDGSWKVVRSNRAMTVEEKEAALPGLEAYVMETVSIELLASREALAQETDEVRQQQWQDRITKLENYVFDPNNIILPAAPTVVEVIR